MGMGQIGRGTPGLISPDTGLNLGAAERQNQLQAQMANAQMKASQGAGIMGALGSIGGGLMSGAGAAGGFGALFSDRRLKTDIEKVGKTNAGLPIYTYKYKGDKTTQMGVMAQDVEKKTPNAVQEIGGFKAVNYKLVK
jgi:ABC-type enterochelin transport system substrate-binding protein